MLNIDWNAPKTPCQTEGCDYPNYHVCLVGKEDLTHLYPDLLQAYIPGQRGKASPFARFGFRSDAHREAISASQKARWAKIKEANRDRDRQIVEDYKSGLGTKQIRIKYGMGHGTIVKILHEARDNGEVEIRTRGYMEHGKRVQKIA